MYWDYNWITTFLVFVLTYLVVFYSTKKPRSIPPGPFLFPVIGNLLSFVGDIIGNLERLRHKYGDIYSLYVGKELMIFLNGYDVIHDALVKKGSAFAERPLNSFDKLVVKNPGIIFSNGKLWKEQRRFALAALKELCFKNGGKNVDEIITNETDHLIKKFAELEYPTDVEMYIKISFSNVLFYIVYKHRFGFEDERVRRILKLSQESTNEFTFTHTMVNCFPFLSSLPFDILNIKRTLDRFHQQLENLQPFVNQIKCKHTQEKSDTVVDLYLNALEESARGDIADTFSEHQLEVTTYDLVMAGSETSATTLRWLLIYFVKYPNIQEKVFEEISLVLGKQKPRLSDRKRLPYTHASVLEVLRISTVAPLAVPHTVTRDLMFHGYLLPKGCTVMTNIHSSNNDPHVWENPEEFRPERFLSEDGNEVVIPKQFIPFSLGPRSCLGETLAKIELFLFVTALVQNFKFLPAVDGEVPSLQGQLGITWSPNPYQIKAVKRDIQ